MYHIGVDLGGSHIVAAVVDDSYTIISRSETKHTLPRTAEEFCHDIAYNVRQAVEAAGLNLTDIASFGIGSPGVVNVDSGIIVRASNLDLTNVPLADYLYKETGCIFHCENDANAAAYGEYLAGAGRGTKDFLTLTLGTGIGGGVILGGRILVGAGYAGGELGHMIIVQDGEPCTCGANGCFEAYASAAALCRQAIASMKQNPDSLMWQLCDHDYNKLTAKMVFDAKDAGDPVAGLVFRKYIAYLGTGIYNYIRIIQPDVLCIGGGISGRGERLIEELEASMKIRDFAKNNTRVTKLKIAELGNDAGLIGAAFCSDCQHI